MKIKKLNLYSHNLEAQKKFYHKQLGFEIKNKSSKHFSIQVGHTLLSFTASEKPHKYHYCFLIPSNHFETATHWLQNKIPLIVNDDGITQHQFKSWNAAAIYYYDPDGNVAELIVRYDLKNESTSEFGVDQFLSVNEIGVPTKDISKTHNLLLDKTNSPFWKGNLQRFGTNGTQDGLFLLINNTIKKTWFPTEVKTESAPFEATIEVEGIDYLVDFNEGVLKI